MAHKNDNQLKHLSFEKLNETLKPEYYSLFQNLGRVRDGVKTIIKIREDVLDLLQIKSEIYK